MGIFTILMEVEGMNEIKFRVWEENIKQMFYNVGIVNDELYLMLDGVGFDVVGDYREFKLMQYTGLKDKNNKGKEIFEGDIVEFNNCNYLRTGGYLDDEILRGKVIFAYGGWMIKTNKGDYDLYPSIFNDEELEVIGNVFEDSHLLEEQHG